MCELAFAALAIRPIVQKDPSGLPGLAKKETTMRRHDEGSGTRRLKSRLEVKWRSLRVEIGAESLSAILQSWPGRVTGCFLRRCDCKQNKQATKDIFVLVNGSRGIAARWLPEVTKGADGGVSGARVGLAGTETD